MTIGFLHTSPLHVATFDALVAGSASGPALHVVEASLLDRARVAGPTSVRAEVGAAVEGLVARGADVVVCTCSTLGAVAEASAPAGRRGVVPVLRVDRAAAVRAGEIARAAEGVVGAVVAVESSLVPTRELLATTAGGAVEVVLSPGAWERFESGDREGYLDAVERTVRELAPRVCVVVLAQVSMTAVADRVAGLTVPVLTTGRAAVELASALASR